MPIENYNQNISEYPFVECEPRNIGESPQNSLYSLTRLCSTPHWICTNLMHPVVHWIKIRMEKEAWRWRPTF